MIPEHLTLPHLGGKLSCLSALGDKRLPDGKLSSTAVLRLTEGAKAHLGFAIPAVKLYVTADALSATSIFKKLDSYEKGETIYFPHRDDVLFHRGGVGNKLSRDRIVALSSFVAGSAETLVVSADALVQKLPNPELFDKYSFTVAKEDIIPPQTVAEKLVNSGYVRQDVIAEIGDFSLKGDIIDVYAVDGKAYRIDFFDELVEEIKQIDVEEMRSVCEVDRVLISPAGEIIFDEDDVEKIKKKLSAYPENDNAMKFADSLHAGANEPSAVWAMPFSDKSYSVFDYIDYAAKKSGRQSVVIFDEPKAINEKLAVLGKEFAGRINALAESGEVLPEHNKAVYSYHEFKRAILLRRKVSFTSLALSNPIFEPTLTLEPKCLPVSKYYLDAGSIYNDLRGFRQSGYKVVLACGSAEKAKAIARSLNEEEVFARFSEDGNTTGEDGEGVLVTPLEIESGFCYPHLRILVVGVSECIGKRHGESVISHKTQFIAPKQGDYVVHRVHGIGICEGTQMVKTGEFEKEFIVLKYRDGDTLYVSTDQTDSLQKFVGEEHPRLNKLGGKEFEREKEKVRSSVKKLAVNLLELYAIREKKLGFKYSEDTVWQKEFEDDFPYEETVDQLKAIDDIKKDMESGKIMDRVVIGDVGFGKTEVAFRAMFKTIIDAKQAVLLAPTTILARQHYEALKPRLEKFDIDCALLTRLQSTKENNETLKRLEDGTLHVVIATHKVLSSKVKFNDLGLLVLDEEQRFGVDHKEKLKEKYPQVNVLTLSATPIPRTLNMALSGIRDISMLETAPRGRLPVQTYVTHYSDALVKDAVARECARGGQVLILLNDVDGLDLYAQKLHSILDGGVRIITAHGQMNPVELEKRMSAFYDKQYDVLVATTIIENGIDLPDANTLIVLDAGHFGLAQLYQLRGRVGRRGVLAHAYFTIPENGTLSELAEKRLQALLDNVEIGSGFKVALSDLSIRGAGNMLGAEQHGHVEKVGYEMYIELLNETIEELRTGTTKKEVKDVVMRVDAPAYIREGYVSGRDKMRIYKEIATVQSLSSRDALVEKLTDVYGAPDKPLLNLINVSLLKNTAKNFDVSKITIDRRGAGASFYDTEIFKNEGLMRAVATHATDTVLTSTIPPTLVFDVNGLPPEERIEKVLNFFLSALD